VYSIITSILLYKKFSLFQFSFRLVKYFLIQFFDIIKYIYLYIMEENINKFFLEKKNFFQNLRNEQSCVSPVPRFDSILISNVNIKKIGNDEYKIKFNNISTLILYQVWNDNPSLNNERVVLQSNIQTWVDLFLQNQPFQPTIIMAQPPQKWVFVLKTVEYINKKLIWRITTKPIFNISTTVNKKLITGKLKNMRFDVGSITYIVNPCPQIYNKPLFNQILTSDIEIIKTSNKIYKIYLKKTSEVTFYQVWSVNNNKRKVYSSNIFNWTNYIKLNRPFEPTTIMELGNCRYAFTIIDVKYLGNNQMTWNVSQKNIANLSTVFTNNLKTGKFENVRFNVDSVSAAGTYYSSLTISVQNCVVTYLNGNVYNGPVTISPYQNNCMTYNYETIPSPTGGTLNYNLTFTNASFSFDKSSVVINNSPLSGDWYANTGSFEYTTNLPSNIIQININDSVLSQLENKNSCYLNLTGQVDAFNYICNLTGNLCFCENSNTYTLSNLVTSLSNPLLSFNNILVTIQPTTLPCNFYFSNSQYTSSSYTSTTITFNCSFFVDINGYIIPINTKNISLNFPNNFTIPNCENC